jgi:hypothetical protein
MELHARVIASPMTEDEVLTFRKDLYRLYEMALQRQLATTRQLTWRQRA